MDDKDLKMDNSNVYRATSNLNTALENPDVTVENTMEINIQDLDNNDQSYVGNKDFIINNNYDSILLENNISNDINNVSNDNVVSNINNVSNDNVVSNINNVSNDNVVSNINNVSSDNVVSNVDNVSYKPTMKPKKKPATGIKLAKEVKAMMIIILFLLIVVFVIPYVYDYFKEMNLVITS